MTKARLAASIGLVALLCLAPAGRADVVVTAAAPPSAAPGAEATVTLYFLNAGQAPAAPDAPSELSGRWTGGEVTLRRADALPVAVAVGGFVAVPYRLTVPSGATGTLSIDVARAGFPRLTVAVSTGSPVVVPATSTSAQPALAKDRRADVPSGSELIPNRPQLPPGDSGTAEGILTRFSPHEPIYFIAGPNRPSAKFQVSFKYQVFNPEGSLAQGFPPLGGLHLAYSQTSFWDWEGESAPFFDNSYRPEVLWSAKDWRLDGGLVSRLGLQVGVNHESNGRDGPESRSMNVAYVRPSVTFGDPEGRFVTFAPKIYAYLDQAEENRDIEDFRGYADLRLIFGDRNGLQAAIIGRVGDDWDKGSVQLDVSYPTRKLFGGNLDLYLHAQFFSGYGESLLEYNEYSNRFRLGVSIVR